MELLKQIRVAVVGIPDCGKSTLVKEIIRVFTKRELPIDVLMNESHYTDGKDIYGNDDSRTIKAAKVFFKYRDVEICLYDCPGHLEYQEQIKQGLEGSSLVLKVIDENRIQESYDYFNNDIFYAISKPTMTLFSHSSHLGESSYNIFDAPEHFIRFANKLLRRIYGLYKKGDISSVDIEEEARNIIINTLSSFKNKGMFFSGGKDSLVGLELLRQCGVLNDVNIMFPKSGYDFDEVIEQVKLYQEQYGVSIDSFKNNGDLSPTDVSVFEWMREKAKANNVIIKEKDFDIVLVQYRASDEGVRSKDYHLVKRDGHYRFSPVFYFSEINIWRFIIKYGLSFCPLYLRGYRSLGDSFCTEPCMPKAISALDILSYIEEHPHMEERGGRKRQDNTEKHTMERLRNEGFF